MINLPLMLALLSVAVTLCDMSNSLERADDSSPYSPVKE